MNIELGAGTGCLGRRFFAPCVEADIDRQLVCGTSPSPIDVICDAREIPARDAKFHIVIICNPYDYGFRREQGEGLLTEIVRIVDKPGKAILISSSLNPFCQPDRIRANIDTVSQATGIQIDMTVDPIEPESIFPNHSFSRRDGSKTTPNMQITLEIQ